ncbi:hypothetical protein CCZ20_26100 [Priestia aryabhattai]|uniref:hypothetical protein n=1 Tax=Priestia aryabhattai TaxID=412384 RepID=UPI000B5090DA|nr:hypothetical protein [Priestia aryabhattai]OVE34502.1 hypothetical protein CCZ20_26100 [Priestia aryabhattai]
MIKIELYYMTYNLKNGMYYVDKSFPQKKKKRNTNVNSTAETANQNPNSKVATHAYNVGCEFKNTEIISSSMIVIDGGIRF